MKLYKLKDVKKIFHDARKCIKILGKETLGISAIIGGFSFCFVFYLEEEMVEKLSLTKWQIQVQNR